MTRWLPVVSILLVALVWSALALGGNSNEPESALAQENVYKVFVAGITSSGAPTPLPTATPTRPAPSPTPTATVPAGTCLDELTYLLTVSIGLQHIIDTSEEITLHFDTFDPFSDTWTTRFNNLVDDFVDTSNTLIMLAPPTSAWNDFDSNLESGLGAFITAMEKLRTGVLTLDVELINDAQADVEAGTTYFEQLEPPDTNCVNDGEPAPGVPTVTIPTPTPTTPACDPAYPTICVPPPPPDLNCGDIPYRNFPVLPPDPHNFDGNGNGVGCET